MQSIQRSKYSLGVNLPSTTASLNVISDYTWLRMNAINFNSYNKLPKRMW